ncbi:MAG TPA: hypothetical protein VGN90_15890 [Pyrinomonadaceae bacterium]|jgi:hypothetical protein|nr:hypothetical protein [Pyrinomonadaceae bacterium]
MKKIMTTIFTSAVLGLTILVCPSARTTAAAQSTSTSYEIIHFVESKGRITNTQNAFDTTMYTHYSGIGKLTVDIQLYDEITGMPIPGRCANGGCTLTYGGGARNRQTIHFEDLVDFSTKNLFVGVAFIQVQGDAPSTFLADVYLVNSRQNPFDLSYVLLPLHPLMPNFRR